MLYNNIPRGFGNVFLKQLQMLFYVSVPNERAMRTLFLLGLRKCSPRKKFEIEKLRNVISSILSIKKSAVLL